MEETQDLAVGDTVPRVPDRQGSDEDPAGRRERSPSPFPAGQTLVPDDEDDEMSESLLTFRRSPILVMDDDSFDESSSEGNGSCISSNSFS